MKYKIQVDKIFFPRKTITEAGEFTIFSAKVLDVIEGEEPSLSYYGTISIKGEMPSIKSGQEFKINLEMEVDPKYGATYKILNLIIDFNFKNKKELTGFLETLTSKKIAEELAKIEDVITLIKNKNDEELLTIKGVGKATLERIYDNFSVYEDFGVAFSKLMPIGISKELIKKMCKHIKNPQTLVELCFENPFKLIDKIPNFGFLKADEIATKCGYLNADTRNKYAILYLLDTYGEQGQSFIKSADLINDLRKLSTSEFSDINRIVGELVAENKVMLVDGGINIASIKYFDLEKKIYEQIQRIKNFEIKKLSIEECNSRIEAIENKQGWNFTIEQRAAIVGAVRSNFSAITGEAGTGKTTVVKAIMQILSNEYIELTSLSAKACQRMTETTGCKAQTIHRLLKLTKENEDYINIEADTVIIDESTMPSGSLFLKLFSAVSEGTRVILLGDIGQLTTIGNCAIFEDLLISNLVPVFKLTQIHRQAKKSAIITSSRSVRRKVNFVEKGFIGRKKLGELLDLDITVLSNSCETMLNEIMIRFNEEMQKFNNVLDVQVITPLKARGEICCNYINLCIQSIYNDKNSASFKGKDGIEIYIGDKVINTMNNYKAEVYDEFSDEEDEDEDSPKKLGVFNGNIGIVKKILSKGVVIDFQGVGLIFLQNSFLDNINLGYCISTHSSQGSQWKSVIATFDMGAYKLLNIEMLYTIITRASESCCVVTKSNALLKSLSTEEKKKKLTFLRFF